MTFVQQEVLSKVAAGRGQVMRLHLPVGSGRTAINLLLPRAVEGCRTALILVPPASVLYYWDTHDRLRREKAGVSSVIFTDKPCTVMPDGPTAHVVSKTVLSRPDGLQWLNNLQPDLIVFDESHPNTTRAYRIGEYVRKNLGRVTVVEWIAAASADGGQW